MHARFREKLVLTVVGWLAAGLIFFPIFWMVLTSFKTEVEAVRKLAQAEKLRKKRERDLPAVRVSRENEADAQLHGIGKERRVVQVLRFDEVGELSARRRVKIRQRT